MLMRAHGIYVFACMQWEYVTQDLCVGLCWTIFIYLFIEHDMLK